MHSQHIGLIANTSKAGAAEMSRNLKAEFERRNFRLTMDTATGALAGVPASLSVEELASACDLLVVLGGDGTMLQVLSGIRGAIPPIFGINIGSLGFLTCIPGNDYLLAVEYIETGRYELSERGMLQVEVLKWGEVISVDRALNDAVISRGELSRLIRMSVRIDGNALTEYNADGLIISTPTGSTAYSLSAGGPVLMPDSGVFMITPICPHVLTNRSVILHEEAVMEIEPSRMQGPVFLTLDGQNAIKVDHTEMIRITKAPDKLTLAMPPGVSWFEVLRQKLKWSGTAV